MISIETNIYGQRILVITEVLDVQKSFYYTPMMFDGVFINPQHAQDVNAILRTVNPVTENRMSYKPFFLTRSMKEEVGLRAHMFDAFVDDINSEEMLNTIKDIQRWRDEYEVRDETEPVNNVNTLFLRVIRLYISRNWLDLNPQLVEGSSLGYVLPVLEVLHQWSMFHLIEWFTFLQTAQEKGYLRSLRFINLIHLCPKCQHSHLLYMETCPRCGSSSLRYEQVIHHFPCANVSPEHTYNVGGQLICPKCHKPLRHIGIDYDRPASIYICQNCNNTFLAPDTKALCTYCHKLTPVNELNPWNVEELEITPEGIHAFMKDNYSISVTLDFFDNYMALDKFRNRLWLIASHKMMGSVVQNLAVGRIWLENSNRRVVGFPDQMLETACTVFATYKVTASPTIFFVDCVLRKGTAAEQLEQFRRNLDRGINALATWLMPGMTINGHVVQLDSETNFTTHELMHQVELLPSKPDVTYGYDDVQHDRKEDAADVMADAVRTADAAEDRQTLDRFQEQLDGELRQINHKPAVIKVITYLRWGLLFLLIVGAISLILAYNFWLK